MTIEFNPKELKDGQRRLDTQLMTDGAKLRHLAMRLRSGYTTLGPGDLVRDGTTFDFLLRIALVIDALDKELNQTSENKENA